MSGVERRVRLLKHVGPVVPFRPELFRTSLSLLAVRTPVSNMKAWMSLLGREHLLSLPRVKSILPDTLDPHSRLLLLKPTIAASDVPSQVPAEALIPHTLELDYSYFSLDDVLTAYLPESVLPPSAFETVGHIAHLNLRDDQMPYKDVIGRVLLDKNPALKTVVTKLCEIEDKFRVLPMQCIAGQPDYNVTVSQSGCTFAFPYDKVYWNSRLESEHLRLVRLFSSGQIV
jgi:tRNA (guanine37-N1)-methyltransferase